MNEPKVMTLEDVKTADFVNLEFQDVIWEDCAVLVSDLSPEITFVDPESRRMFLNENAYNDTWRCWTGVPTMAQMRAARGQTTVSDMIEDIKQKICDNICKYSELCMSQKKDPDEALDILVSKYCGNCPLNLL